VLLLSAATTALFVHAGCGGEEVASTVSVDRVQAEKAREHQIARLERRVNGLKRERRREARTANSTGSGGEPGSVPAGSLTTAVSGQVGLTLGAPGAQPDAMEGDLSSGPAWSTIKAPIVLRVLDDAGGPAGLAPGRRELAESAIAVSDNEAAAQLFGDLERGHGGLAGASAAVTGVLREAGDATTTVSTVGRGSFSTYGQTEWSLALQHRFMSALSAGCAGTAESRRYLLDLMGRASDGWGFGALGLPARWKGGWGPGLDGRYLARQMGEVTVDGKRIVATVAAIPDDGQFASAQAMATEAAQWVVAHAEVVGPPAPC
jgi:hypothetical protein